VTSIIFYSLLNEIKILSLAIQRPTPVLRNQKPGLLMESSTKKMDNYPVNKISKDCHFNGCEKLKKMEKFKGINLRS
jgi:hypothetical protein